MGPLYPQLGLVVKQGLEPEVHDTVSCRCTTVILSLSCQNVWAVFVQLSFRCQNVSRSCTTVTLSLWCQNVSCICTVHLSFRCQNVWAVFVHCATVTLSLWCQNVSCICTTVTRVPECSWWKEKQADDRKVTTMTFNVSKKWVSKFSTIYQNVYVQIVQCTVQ